MRNYIVHSKRFGKPKRKSMEFTFIPIHDMYAKVSDSQTKESAGKLNGFFFIGCMCVCMHQGTWITELNAMHQTNVNQHKLALKYSPVLELVMSGQTMYQK